MGYYCPSGTLTATQYPCPPGTYGTITRLQQLSSCTDCPSGSFCSSYGAVNTSGLCSPGYACFERSSTSTPTNSIEGIVCPIGTFCPRGSSIPINCTAGSYCASALLEAPTGYCYGGYFCTSSSSVPNPVNAINGNICPAGSYCTNGSYVPISCPTGTYNQQSGASVLSQCLQCKSGYYCNITGTILSTLSLCWEGYYCPNGTITPFLTCPYGYSCPLGTGDPIPCGPGSYQVSIYQSIILNYIRINQAVLLVNLVQLGFIVLI